MITSVNDVAMKEILGSQLKAAEISWLNLEPSQDYRVGEHQFAVFAGMLSKKVGEATVLIDAWLVVGGGTSGFYNRDNQPQIRDAVAVHIGRLAVEGKVKVVEVPDATPRAPRKRKARSPKD